MANVSETNINKAFEPILALLQLGISGQDLSLQIKRHNPVKVM